MSAPMLVAWRLEGRRVLVVGGGRVAGGRIASALAAGAEVHVVATAVADVPAGGVTSQAHADDSGRGKKERSEKLRHEVMEKVMDMLGEWGRVEAMRSGPPMRRP